MVWEMQFCQLDLTRLDSVVCEMQFCQPDLTHLDSMLNEMQLVQPDLARLDAVLSEMQLIQLDPKKRRPTPGAFDHTSPDLHTTAFAGASG
jgi:hypothetical protein